MIFRDAAKASPRNTAGGGTFRLRRHEEEARVTRNASAKATPSQPYPADKARGGEIILRTPLQRWGFIAGLAGAVLLVLALALFAKGA